MNQHKPLQTKKKKNIFKLHSQNITAFMTSASPCKGGHKPTTHIRRLPLTDLGLRGQCSASSHRCRGLLMEQRPWVQHFKTPVLHKK